MNINENTVKALLLNLPIMSLGLVSNLSTEIKFFVKIISPPKVNKIAKLYP